MAREILTPLFTKLGLSNEDVDALFSEQIPDDLQERLGGVIKNTTTLDAAKSNQNVRNHIMALTLKGVDDAVLGYAKSNYGEDLGEDFFTSISEERKTSAKVIKLIEALSQSYSGKISALEEATKSKGSKASEEALKRIEELTNTVKTKDSSLKEWEEKFSNREKEFHQTRVKGELLRHMSGINWKDTTPEMVELFTNTVVSKAMNGAGFSFDEKNGFKIHSKDDPSIGIFGEDQTRSLTPQEYILDLAKPFTAKNDAARGGNNGNPHVPNTKSIDTSKMTRLQRESYEHQQRKMKALQGQK